jgi:hypothetical protein
MTTCSKSIVPENQVRALSMTVSMWIGMDESVHVDYNIAWQEVDQGVDDAITHALDVAFVVH